MSTGRPDYELLITRRLDGVISDEESLELDRAMLRDPEWRETFEAHERTDKLVAEALARELGSRGGDVDLGAITQPRKTIRFPQPHRGWLLIPGAIAAALLALVVPTLDLSETNHKPITTPIVSAPSFTDRSPIPTMDDYRHRPVSAPEGLLRNVNTMKRNTGRELIGVIGEDGNVYWMEVDRTRTITVPQRDHAITSNQL